MLKGAAGTAAAAVALSDTGIKGIATRPAHAVGSSGQTETFAFNFNTDNGGSALILNDGDSATFNGTTDPTAVLTITFDNTGSLTVDVTSLDTPPGGGTWTLDINYTAAGSSGGASGVADPATIPTPGFPVGNTFNLLTMTVTCT